MAVPVVEVRRYPMDDQSMRADARRNRVRLLAVASEVFATEGLSVPVREIARRAGVGTGTISRHFPTKDDLFAAILRSRIEGLVDQGDALAAREDPGSAFFLFLAVMVRGGASHRGLAEQLTDHLARAVADRSVLDRRTGFDELCHRLEGLLTSAQAAGAVRADVVLADVEALMAGAVTRDGPLEPILSVITEGLRAR